MKFKILVYIVISIILLFYTFILAQVPEEFYKKGFPESSGRYEPSAKGISDIEFFAETTYYETPYDIKAYFPFEKVPECTITEVTVNGKEIENFVVFNNYIYSRFRKANGKDDLVIACMVDWNYEKTYTVQAHGITPEGDKVNFSVSATAPKKEVEFHLPGDKYESKYIRINFDKGEIKDKKINSIMINGLPVKEYRREDNSVFIPVSWGTNSRYDVTINTDKGDVSFKILGHSSQMSFGYPSADFHFYYLSYTFSKDKFPAFKVETVYVNGNEVRDYEMTDDGENRYDNKVTGNYDLNMKVMCNWQKGNYYKLKVEGTDEDNNPVSLEAKGYAEGGFGYWNKDWRYYATVLVKERAGIKREKQPVHLKMALYSDRLKDPEKEIRVVELNSFIRTDRNKFYNEIPSQVYNVANWDNEDLINKTEIDKESGEKVVRYLPTTTLEVAFFVDIEAYSEKIYLVFYGNPDASLPDYTTDLSISNRKIGQVIENGMYKFDLDDNSGAFFSIFLKKGKNVTLEHKLETNGAVHWNPGIYSPPHAWVHASDWKNPNFEQITGAVFHMTKRYAPLPHMENVEVTITYVFYAGKPYVITSSITEITEEIYCKALRNGEIVFNHEQLNEFAYKTKLGAVETMKIKGSRKHPEHAIRIPYDTPWLAFINRDKKIGFGGVLMNLANTNKYGGLSDAEQPYFYVANGPWIYFSRALNYSFGSNNPSRMIRAKKGSIYYEKTAYMPFVLGDKPSDEFKEIENVAKKLNHPLNVMYYLDTDTRNNKSWVVPILVEPFDEGVEGAVGQPEKKK